jgi:hypothetical protein
MNATVPLPHLCRTHDETSGNAQGFAALADTVRFYDHLRVYEYDPHSEQGARVQAEFYLRRKLPDLDADAAAVILADALALRAAARVNP